MNEYAPIVLFVYARAEHTKQTLEFLKDCDKAAESELYIYSDGYKGEADRENVLKVRTLIRQYDHWFKQVHIIENENNVGLASNIINGVTRVIRENKQAIVLEDDIVVSPNFLNYMNETLNRYQYNHAVWHITGWNYPITKSPDDKCDAYLWRGMNCWGWATWQDRWENFSRDPDALINNWDDDQISAFNLDGKYDFWEQVRRNHDNTLRTWAIFWYATIFKNQGLCLNPAVSLVENIGNDGSGENCGVNKTFKTQLSELSTFTFPEVMEENTWWLNEIKSFYIKSKPSIFRVMASKIKKALFK